MDNDTYLKTYISKFEGVLLDQVRKHVECDTKNTLYASAVQDFQKKIEDLEKSNSDLKSALDQALNGLQAVTLDKDNIKTKHEKREIEFELICAELEKVRVELKNAQNQAVVAENKILDIQHKLNAAISDAETIRNNYQIALKKFEECNIQFDSQKQELETLKKKKKTVVSKTSDWIDGNEV